MRDCHLTPESLRCFLENARDEEASQLLLHHLAVCPACFAVGGYILTLFEAGVLPLPLCLIEIDLERSRSEAPALLQKLRRFHPARQRELISDLPRFRSWGLAELLCRESERLCGEDPAAAEHAADLAVAVAMALQEWEPAEASWHSELRAFAWAHLGNARRVIGDLRGAEGAFAVADFHWQEGYRDAGDIMGYEAHLLALKASLCRAKRILPEALALLNRAREAEPSLRLAAIIVENRARILEEMGDVASAISELENGAATVEAAGDLRLSFIRWHNLLDLLSKCGRLAEAKRLWHEVEERALQAATTTDLIRLRWIEARLAALEGKVDEALAAFAEVESRFLSLNMAYEVALAGLERALLLLEEGRFAEVEALSSGLVLLFQARDVDREALAALTLFDQAVWEKSAGLVLAERLIAYLREAQRDPSVRFEQGRSDGAD